MKGGNDPMNHENASFPCESLDGPSCEILLQNFPKKDFIEQVECNSQDTQSTTFTFNGKFKLAKTDVFVGNKLAIPNLLLYGDCDNALSDTNKRLLMDKNMITDYVTPNPALPIVLGFGEEDSKLLVYALILHEIPICLDVKAYDRKTGEKLENVRITPRRIGGSIIPIDDEEAIRIIADFIIDNNLTFSANDLFEVYGEIDKANENINLSYEAIEYGSFSDYDDWEKLEYALAYEFAADYYNAMKESAAVAYDIISEKYEKAEYALAETSFTFGINNKRELCISDKIATFSNSFIVNLAYFKETGNFIPAHLIPILEFYDKRGYGTVVTDEVIDSTSDNLRYIAESLVDDLEFDIYLS